MKKIHPKYYTDVKVTCACGATITTGSVLPGPIRVEICSQCHPFFTGEKKLVDTEGRVDKFERLRQEAKKYEAVNSKKTKKEEVVKTPVKRKSLREMLQEVK